MRRPASGPPSPRLADTARRVVLCSTSSHRPRVCDTVRHMRDDEDVDTTLHVLEAVCATCAHDRASVRTNGNAIAAVCVSCHRVDVMPMLPHPDDPEHDEPATVVRLLPYQRRRLREANAL